MEMHRILAVDSHVVEGAQEYMDDFSWQHTVVTAKVYRLGDGEWMRRARMMQGIQRQWPQVTDYLHHGF
jgi:hypothetical protein